MILELNREKGKYSSHYPINILDNIFAANDCKTARRLESIFFVFSFWEIIKILITQ